MSLLSGVLCGLLLLIMGNRIVAKENDPAKVIIDTDIGTDLDDAFAVALALRSSELEVLGITTDFGDTVTRTRIVARMLHDTGFTNIPVATGAVSEASEEVGAIVLCQRRYGERWPLNPDHEDSVQFISEQIRRYPGQITLIIIGPLPNIGRLISQEPETFKKLKQVLLMGGSISSVGPTYGRGFIQPAYPEWNIVGDIGAAQRLFQSEIPLRVFPLDSTANLNLDEDSRTILFAQGTPMTDALTLLYHEWAAGFGLNSPTLYDVMPVAFLINPALCPTTPLY